jgi:hypothetical protein
MAMWSRDDGGSLTLLLRSAMTHESAAEHLCSVFIEQMAPLRTADLKDPSPGSRRPAVRLPASNGEKRKAYLQEPENAA